MSQVIQQTQCQCGAVAIEFVMPKATIDLNWEQLQLRQCDCDFCIARQVAWLSHPQATIKISMSDDLESEQQGSNQAKFLSCPNCSDMIAVIIENGHEWRGAVNGNLFKALKNSLDTVIVSPKQLSASEKLARWLTLWAKFQIFRS